MRRRECEEGGRTVFLAMQVLEISAGGRGFLLVTFNQNIAVVC